MDPEPRSSMEQEVFAEPEEESYSVFSSLLNALLVLQENAWYIVILGAIMYYVWIKKLEPIYRNWSQEREIQKEYADAKKDPEKSIAREEARYAAINRLQEQYNKQAVEFTEKMKEKEEKKRAEWVEKQVKGPEGRKLKEDYNPLAGGGTGSYRAPRRSTCPGGSCNR